MRICFIGKIPPIEGGVSVSTFWLAHGLAKKGHQVFVVTNAMEVEPEYRIHLDRSDLAVREETFPETGGFLRVFDTEPPTSRMTHIPAHNPFLTKLASIATQVVRENDCEAIFAHYFEPYGLAAYLASIWTGVPFLVRHAGSDLDRLMRVPQLSTAYKEALRRADMLVTSGRLVDRFLGMGVPPEKIFSAEGYAPPPAFFHGEAAPLDLRRLPKLLQPKIGGEPAEPDPAKPTIGIYGKVGFFKGSFDLVKAVALLKRQGLDFNFVAMTQGRSFPAFEKAIREAEIEDCTWVLPFQPNWRVPGFIRACTAVCFLERDFPIKIHTPTVAVEVLKAGGCLVLSREIAAKQAYRDQLEDGGNLVLVEDPKVHAELAAKLRQLIENPEQARQIGRRGAELVADGGARGGARGGALGGAYDRYVASWEDLIRRLAGHASGAFSLAEKTRRQIAEAGGRALAEEPLPPGLLWARRLLGEAFAAELVLFQQETAGHAFRSPRQIAEAFADFLARRFAAGQLAADAEAAAACLEFEQERRSSRRDDESSRRVMPFPAADQLLEAPLDRPRVLAMTPLRSRQAKLVRFPIDPLPFFQPAPAGAEGGRQETCILFHRTPNLMTSELKVAAETARLLELCDGSRRVSELLAELAPEDGSADDPAPRRQAVLAALKTLYDHRILAFRA